MNPIVVVVICVVIVFLACVGMILFFMKIKSAKRRETNKKVAIFKGKMVNKKAEGTMGYGLLFGEAVAEGSTYVMNGIAYNSGADCQKNVCIVLQNISTGEAFKKHFVGDLVIGRSTESNGAKYLAIPSPEISRQHCQIYFSNGVLCIRDLGSKNRTYLNDAILQKDMLVNSGDTIGLGRLKFKLSIMH